MTKAESLEAAFIAKITASTTHEVRNVLAIVKESAGLIEDLVRSAGKRGQLKEDKLLRTVGRIDAQVGRGAELLTNLNRFAHSLDHDRERIDLNDAAQRVAALCERFARQRRHAVCARTDAEEIAVTVNVLWLQMALFTGVECLLELLSEPGTVVLEPQRLDESLAVRLTGEIGDTPVELRGEEATGWTRLVELVDSIGATVGTSGGPEGIVIVFPESDAAGS